MNNSPIEFLACDAREKGMALIMSLILLCILTVGVMVSTRSITTQTRLAANLLSGDVAAQIAEGTNRAAEGLLSRGQLAALIKANSNGLYFFNTLIDPQWSGWGSAAPIDWSNSATAKQSTYIGNSPTYGAYIVEQLPDVVGGGGIYPQRRSRNMCTALPREALARTAVAPH